MRKFKEVDLDMRKKLTQRHKDSNRLNIKTEREQIVERFVGNEVGRNGLDSQLTFMKQPPGNRPSKLGKSLF